MKALHVEFKAATPPTRRHWWIVVVLLGAGVVCSGWALRDAHERSALLEEKAVQMSKRHAQAALAEAKLRNRTTAAPPPYAAHALEALRQQQFPLDAALTALETVAIPGVRVIAVDIVTVEAAVHVQVEFSDYDVLLKYLAELNAGEAVPRWVLLNAQAGAAGGAKSSTAALRASWGR